MKYITVEDLVNRYQLEVVTGHEHLDRKIHKSRVHRPGLEFVGYFEFFPQERVQIIGLKEMNFLQMLPEEERNTRIRHIVKYHPPCFVVTWNYERIQFIMEHCQKEGIPLLRTTEKTTKFIELVDNFLIKSLAEEIHVHGVCINVAGIGILLRGKSGVGKSETALSLIRRGHRLVADDIVVLKKINPETLIGTHDGNTKEFLALRSIGLINVARVYGRSAYQEETRILLDIELTEWKENELYNDLELEQKFTHYLDVPVPNIQISLQPGRDVAGLVEAAANNWNLQMHGYSAAEEFMQRVEAKMQSS